MKQEEIDVLLKELQEEYGEEYTEFIKSDESKIAEEIEHE